MSASADVVALVREWIANAEEEVAAGTNDYFHIVVEEWGR